MEPLRTWWRALAVVGGLCAVLVPGLSSASGTCGTSSCTAGLIEMVAMSSRVRIRLDLTAAEKANLTNCTLESGDYFTLWPTGHALYKEIFAMLRSAQIADRPVTIRTVDGSADCTVAYVRAY